VYGGGEKGRAYKDREALTKIMETKKWGCMQRKGSQGRMPRKTTEGQGPVFIRINTKASQSYSLEKCYAFKNRKRNG